MSLNQIVASLGDGSWLDNPQEVLKHAAYTPNKKELNSLFESTKQAIANEDVLEASNCLFLGLLLDELRFLPKVRKKSLLRISNYSFDSKTLDAVVSSLLNPGLGLENASLVYLRSLSNLYELANVVRREYEQLRDWMLDEKETGIKTALALLDFLCLKQAVSFHLNNKQVLKSRHSYFFTVEELAGGFSTLLAIYGCEVGKLEKNGPISDKVDPNTCMDILNSAAHMAVFREWETRVNHLGYTFEKLEEKSFELKPPSFEFMRAMEMGHIHTLKQHTIQTLEMLSGDQKLQSFMDRGAKLAVQFEDVGLIEKKTYPVERYWFGFPEPALVGTAAIKEFLREEFVAVNGTARDLVASPQVLLEFEVAGGISFWDLLVTSRIFQVMRSITSAKLIPCLEDEPKVVFQSLIPVMHRDLLEKLFGETVGEDKAKPLIDLMATDIQASNIDIQYRPILPVGDDEFWIPANVFANSNVYRNPFMNSNKRIYSDGTEEPDVEMLRSTFRDQGFEVAPTVKYQFAGDEGELDVIAYSEDMLFVLECKNSLLPTSSHELIQSFDHVQKAVHQLNRFVGHFADPAFQRLIEKKAGFRFVNHPRIVTGIVLSNRMFQGYKPEGHPVRGLYEFVHFLELGESRIGDESLSFWSGDKLVAEDVRKYLEDDITYTGQWGSLEGFFEEYEFADDFTVRSERLLLNNKLMAEQHGFANASDRIDVEQEKFERVFDQHSMIDEFKFRFDNEKKKLRRKKRRGRRNKLDAKVGKGKRRKK